MERDCPECQVGADCPAGDACTSSACVAGGCVTRAITCDDDRGLCTTKSCDPATGCVFTPVSCDDGNPCTVDDCLPGSGCVHSPVSPGQPGGCADGLVCCPGSGCTALGTATDCSACGDVCGGLTPICQPGVGCVACLTAADCPIPDDPCRVAVCTAGACGTELTACPLGDVCVAGTGCSCTAGGVVCGGHPSCGVGGTCFCSTTIEGALVCRDSGECPPSSCGGSGECDDGYACVVNTCCDGPACLPLCGTVVAASRAAGEGSGSDSP